MTTDDTSTRSRPRGVSIVCGFWFFCLAMLAPGALEFVEHADLLTVLSMMGAFALMIAAGVSLLQLKRRAVWLWGGLFFLFAVADFWALFFAREWLTPSSFTGLFPVGGIWAYSVILQSQGELE